jgi:hypothetical protein
MEPPIKVGDIVKLKKPHPCGSDEWEVIRVGADIGIKCRKCHHRVLINSGKLRKRIKSIVSSN